jgi:hypothetical protein
VIVGIPWRTDGYHTAEDTPPANDANPGERNAPGAFRLVDGGVSAMARQHL